MVTEMDKKAALALSDSPWITNVHVQDLPGSVRNVAAWNEAHAPLTLPEDMALFYSAYDGLHVTWDVVADSPLPLGCMHINKLENVVPAECLQWSPGPQLPRTRLWSQTHGMEPSDDGPGRFHSPTSPCVCRRRLGLVAMVFDRETGPPSFWYLDRCRCWYKLAD